MHLFTPLQTRRALLFLTALHILVLCASNYFVQLPMTVFGYNTTWGTFTFPFVYLATDLTVKIFAQVNSRRIIFKAMFPALILSYIVGVVFQQGVLQPGSALLVFNAFVFRIAFASFIAYLCGQLLDIAVFSKLRKQKAWWKAPMASTTIGNAADTFLFYIIAFYASSDSFMAANWVEIATSDYLFKVIVSVVIFLPGYGFLLKILEKQLQSPLFTKNNS